MHICISNQGIIASDIGLSPDCVTIENKFQWNLNQNLSNLVDENAFENVVFKMMAILSGQTISQHISSLTFQFLHHNPWYTYL